MHVLFLEAVARERRRRHVQQRLTAAAVVLQCLWRVRTSALESAERRRQQREHKRAIAAAAAVVAERKIRQHQKRQRKEERVTTLRAWQAKESTRDAARNKCLRSRLQHPNQRGESAGDSTLFWPEGTCPSRGGRNRPDTAPYLSTEGAVVAASESPSKNVAEKDGELALGGGETSPSYIRQCSREVGFGQMWHYSKKGLGNNKTCRLQLSGILISSTSQMISQCRGSMGNASRMLVETLRQNTRMWVGKGSQVSTIIHQHAVRIDRDGDAAANWAPVALAQLQPPLPFSARRPYRGQVLLLSSRRYFANEGIGDTQRKMRFIEL